jgi:hypothetical protein
MDNLAEIVKLFYSQHYPRAYDAGSLISAASIQESTAWPFHIHGLDHESLEELEEDGVDELTYQCIQVIESFDLELFHFLLRDFRDDRWRSRSKLPEAMIADVERDAENLEIELSSKILETYELYRNSGWAYPYPFRMTIRDQDVLGIRVVRDGSDGLLELFDSHGERLGSAYTRGAVGIAWRELDDLIPAPPEYDPPLSPPEYYPPICPPELES